MLCPAGAGGRGFLHQRINAGSQGSRSEEALRDAPGAGQNGGHCGYFDCPYWCFPVCAAVCVLRRILPEQYSLHGSCRSWNDPGGVVSAGKRCAGGQRDPSGIPKGTGSRYEVHRIPCQS